MTTITGGTLVEQGISQPMPENRLRLLLCEHALDRLVWRYVEALEKACALYACLAPTPVGTNDCICDHTMVPAALAMRGNMSAHSFATGPAMAEPFISPFGLIITPALSSK